MKVAVLATDNREHYKDYHTPAPHFGTAQEALFQGFAMLPEIEVHVVSCIRQKVGAPEKIAPNIFFHSLVVPKIGWIRTGFQGCVRAVRAKLAQIHPHVVHAQGTERECAVEAVFSGFPRVLTIHGNMRRVARVMQSRPFSYLWLMARLETWTVPRFDGVVCITRHTREQVSGLAKRTWLMPNAVDASFFDIVRRPRPVVPRLLCVGQVYEVKNQVRLVQALDTVAQEHKFVMEFVGEAKPEQPYAAKFLDLLKTRPWCVHAGFASRAVLKEKLSDATLLIQASLEDNCPMAVLEAMAAGVPVLASNVGGLPDLVEDGVTGFFCDPESVQSVSHGVERILSNLPSADVMGSTAKAMALRRFHPRAVAEGHVRIYQELLSAGA